MNYFIEGLQGSGKSTLVRKLSELHPDHSAICEGDYSPVELAWCAYVDEAKYQEILEKYTAIRSMIEEKSFSEGDKRIVCYTKIITDVPGFHKDLEQYEIYNGRTSFDDFKDILLRRYKAWQDDRMIFECSLFQNTIEDMILFRCFTDEDILAFYRQVREALDGKDYRIFYLKADDLRGNLDVIRKEPSASHPRPRRMMRLRPCLPSLRPRLARHSRPSRPGLPCIPAHRLRQLLGVLHAKRSCKAVEIEI